MILKKDLINLEIDCFFFWHHFFFVLLSVDLFEIQFLAIFYLKGTLKKDLLNFEIYSKSFCFFFLKVFVLLLGENFEIQFLVIF